MMSSCLVNIYLCRIFQYVHEGLWQTNIGQFHSIPEQMSNVTILEARYATANTRNIEEQFGMVFGKADKLFTIVVCREV